MSEKDASRINEVLVAIYEKIIKIRYEQDNDDKLKHDIADTIAELGGGKIFMSYLLFLQEQGLEVEIVNNCFFIILNALWNATDDSLKLSVALAENGLFEMLKELLKTLREKYLTNKKVSINEINRLKLSNDSDISSLEI